MIRRRLVPLVLLGALACSDPGMPSLQLVPVLDIITGDGQVDTVAKELPIAITARAADKVSAAAMPGVILNWFKVTGADSVFVAAGATNDSGIARLRWTLGTKAGPQSLVAWALDGEGRRAVHASASASALPGPITYAGFTVPRIRVLGESTFVLPVLATDTYGNSVTNPPVTAFVHPTVTVPVAEVVTAVGNGQWRTARPVSGGVSFVLDTPLNDDTLHLLIYAPAGAYRAEQTWNDSLWVETGVLAFTRFDSTSQGTAAQPTAIYSIVSGMSIRTHAAVPPDTVRFEDTTLGSRDVDGLDSGSGGLGFYAIRLGPDNDGHYGAFFAEAGNGRWRYRINGFDRDSLVITR